MFNNRQAIAIASDILRISFYTTYSEFKENAKSVNIDLNDEINKIIKSAKTYRELRGFLIMLICETDAKICGRKF